MRAKDIGRATEGELQHEVVRLRWELVRWRRLAGRLRRALSARRAAARSGTFRLELPVRGRLSA